MRSFVLRGAAAVGLAAALLIAGCGGGGGNPGACVSGSPEVCAAGESSDPSRPETSQAWAKSARWTASSISRATTWTRFTSGTARSRRSTPRHTVNIGRYFHDLLTPELDPSGQRKDRFSFIVNQTDADSLLTGATTTYGVQWESDAQGRQRAAFVEAGSPAQAAGLARGAELVEVTSTGTPDWFPNGAGRDQLHLPVGARPGHGRRHPHFGRPAGGPAAAGAQPGFHGRAQGRLSAVQRPHPGRAGQADRRAGRRAASWLRRPGARRALQRRRLPVHRAERFLDADRTGGRRQGVRTAAVQRQAPGGNRRQRHRFSGLLQVGEDRYPAGTPLAAPGPAPRVSC